MKTLTKRRIEEIRKNPNKQDWCYLSRYYKLSDDFIREFQNYVYLQWISTYQTLSEDFIREFQDKIYWGCVSRNQKLSKNFIFEFIDILNFDLIIKYQNHLSKETINELKLIKELKK